MLREEKKINKCQSADHNRAEDEGENKEQSEALSRLSGRQQRRRREKKGAAGENHLDTKRPRLWSQAAARRTQEDCFNWPDAWRRTARQRLDADGTHHVSRKTEQQMLKNHLLQDGEHVCSSVASQLAIRSPKVSFFFFYPADSHHHVCVWKLINPVEPPLYVTPGLCLTRLHAVIYTSS